jgi:HlyD family secretion protein
MILKYKKYIIIGIVLLIVGLIVLKKSGVIGSHSSIKVVVEKVRRHTIIETISASGKIQPETEVKISPEVSGEIVDIYVKEGDKVKQGDLLLKIKPDLYVSALDRAIAALNSSKANLSNSKARLKQTEAQLAQIKLQFERNKKLWQDKAISDQDYENIKAQYETKIAELEAAKESIHASEFSVSSAEASVKEANENLAKTSIFAPMDGTISALLVEKGERVVGTAQMAGTELLRVADMNRMEVKVEVNENDIVHIKLGDTAKIDIDAYLNHPFKGIVTEIANSANTTGLSAEQVTTFNVKILILKSSYDDLLEGKPENYFPLRPGMSATVDIQTEKANQVLSIPMQAVTTRSDSSDSDESQEIVFVYHNDTVKSVIVTTGIQDNDFIEIKQGLSETDEVVVEPYTAISSVLKDGMVVEKTSSDKLFTGNAKK